MYYLNLAPIAFEILTLQRYKNPSSRLRVQVLHMDILADSRTDRSHLGKQGLFDDILRG